jgi:DNA-binding transcriptional MocR family regulator/dihydrodipicolinate reductase
MYGQYKVKSASEFMMLGVGQPSPQILTDSLKFVKSEISEIDVLQYGLKQGFESYRELIKRMYKELINCDITSKDVYMTNGISQGIFMMASLLKNKGYDTVYVEDLTYFIMINIFKDLGFKIKSFDLNSSYNFEPKSIIYLIPFCNNPTGKSINLTQLYDFISFLPHDTIVFSDETYHFLHYNKNQLNPLSYYSNKIISFGTFSKILCPGVRLGWMYSTIEIDGIKLNTFLDDTGFMDSGGSVNPVMAYNIVNGINKNFEEYKLFLDNIITDLRIKNEFVQNQFGLYPDTFEIMKPEGGYFLLIKSLKVDSDTLLKMSSECNFSFHQANKFSVDKTHPNEFRISVSYYSLDDFIKYFPDRLKKLTNMINSIENSVDISLYGIGRLGGLVEKELNLKGYNFNVIDRNLQNLGNIVIDVTSPEGTINLIEKCITLKEKPRLIIGTTGHSDDQLNKIKDYSKYAPVIYCSNFSDGIQNLIIMIRNLNFTTKSIEIKDVHHIHKKDSPSGTAKLLKKELSNIYNIPIKINSERTGEVIGYHEIILNGDNETIKLIHNALDRNIFAKGSLKMIEKIKTLNNGFYN